MFSKELQELDCNTVKFMIEEQEREKLGAGEGAAKAEKKSCRRNRSS